MNFNVLDGTGDINQVGIDHYNKLINALLAKGKFYYCSVIINYVFYS